MNISQKLESNSVVLWAQQQHKGAKHRTPKALTSEDFPPCNSHETVKQKPSVHLDTDTACQGVGNASTENLKAV